MTKEEFDNTQWSKGMVVIYGQNEEYEVSGGNFSASYVEITLPSNDRYDKRFILPYNTIELKKDV